eukprot:scaffold249342_cov62-Cyclotella_meneghiniana.AAC.5
MEYVSPTSALTSSNTEEIASRTPTVQHIFSRLSTLELNILIAPHAFFLRVAYARCITETLLWLRSICESSSDNCDVGCIIREVNASFGGTRDIGCGGLRGCVPFHSLPRDAEGFSSKNVQFATLVGESEFRDGVSSSLFVPSGARRPIVIAYILGGIIIHVCFVQ